MRTSIDWDKLATDDRLDKAHWWQERARKSLKRILGDDHKEGDMDYDPLPQLQATQAAALANTDTLDPVAVYQLRLRGIGEWMTVTREQWVKAEQLAGFHNHRTRPDDPATGGFSNDLVEGRIVQQSGNPAWQGYPPLVGDTPPIGAQKELYGRMAKLIKKALDSEAMTLEQLRTTLTYSLWVTNRQIIKRDSRLAHKAALEETKENP